MAGLASFSPCPKAENSVLAACGKPPAKAQARLWPPSSKVGFFALANPLYLSTGPQKTVEVSCQRNSVGNGAFTVLLVNPIGEYPALATERAEVLRFVRYPYKRRFWQASCRQHCIDFNRLEGSLRLRINETDVE